MNEQELQGLLDRGNNCDKLVTVSDIPNPDSNRTLLFAANDYETFHVYLMTGVLYVERVVEHGPLPVKYGTSLPLSDLTPPEGLQVYSGSTEAEFTHLLLNLGVKLDFDLANKTTENSRPESFIPHSLPVAGPSSRPATADSAMPLTDMAIWDQIIALILVFGIDQLDALLGKEITEPSEITRSIAGKIQAFAEIIDTLHRVDGHARNVGSWLKSNPQVEYEITNGDPRKAVGMALAWSANQVFTSEDIASAIDTAQDAYVAWNVALEDFLKDKTPENMAKFEEAKKVFKAMNYEAERRAGVATEPDN